MSDSESDILERAFGRPRLTAGILIYGPRGFFRWTILPHAYCFGVVAFAFHMEHEFRNQPLLVSKPNDPQDLGLREWLDLERDSVVIDPSYGALRIANPVDGLVDIAIDDDGRLSASGEAGEATASHIDRGEAELFFDLARPNARQQVKRAREHAIIIDALQVRGRKNSPLADKETIESGSFYAGFSVERNASTFVFEGAKLFDVELRVDPRLMPDDLASTTEQSSPDQPVQSGHSAKKTAAEAAIAALWPNGVPSGLSAKDRYRRIELYARQHGLSVPSERTVRRALYKA